MLEVFKTSLGNRGQNQTSATGATRDEVTFLAWAVSWYQKIMADVIRGTVKRRGRPKTTGPGAQIGTRWQPELLEQIDIWAQRNGVASRAVAIRRLVELGLTGTSRRTEGVPQEPVTPTMTRERAAFLKAMREQ